MLNKIIEIYYRIRIPLDSFINIFRVNDFYDSDGNGLSFYLKKKHEIIYNIIKR